jgi:hypothetical protein
MTVRLCVGLAKTGGHLFLPAFWLFFGQAKVTIRVIEI